MNRSLLVLGITLAAVLPARADLTHKIQSSVQLEVGGASTRAIRVGNSYSISGTGVDTSVTAGGSTTSDALGGLGAATNGVNAITIPDATQKTAGNSFSFATSYTQGDTVPTSAPTVGAVPAFGDVTSTAGGVNTGLAGTITAGAVTISPGGANTTAIGQVITELQTR
jgi:hypothetical protein